MVRHLLQDFLQIKHGIWYYGEFDTQGYWENSVTMIQLNHHIHNLNLGWDQSNIQPIWQNP